MINRLVNPKQFYPKFSSRFKNLMAYLGGKDNSCKSSLFIHNLHIGSCHNSNWWRDLSCFSPTPLQICRADRVRTGADRTHLGRTFYKLFYNPRIQRHTLRTRGPLPLLAIAAALLCPGHGFDFSTRFLLFERCPSVDTFTTWFAPDGQFCTTIFVSVFRHVRLF